MEAVVTRFVVDGELHAPENDVQSRKEPDQKGAPAVHEGELVEANVRELRDRENREWGCLQGEKNCEGEKSESDESGAVAGRVPHLRNREFGL